MPAVVLRATSGTRLGLPIVEVLAEPEAPVRESCTPDVVVTGPWNRSNRVGALMSRDRVARTFRSSKTCHSRPSFQVLAEKLCLTKAGPTFDGLAPPTLYSV